MKRNSKFVGLALLVTAVVATACSGRPGGAEPQIVQPGAPGERSQAIDGGAERAPVRTGHSAADVHFMQGMIAHHAQALVMTELAPDRASREDVRLLARRIEVAQSSEIELMQRWLRARGEPVPEVVAGGTHDHHAHHAHHAGHGDHALMPGMLTEQELERLAAASGPEFDRLFLEFMIRHHEGALVMVADLFAAEGGGHESEMFQFASEVDGDQRIEIERMRRMLAAGRR